MTSALTQIDLSLLKLWLDSGDRAGFYLQYYQLTGSKEALFQAMVSSYSGPIGQAALYSNAVAIDWLTSRGRRADYPGSTNDFSLLIAKNLLDNITIDVNRGGTGILDDTTVFNLAKQQWADHGVLDCFPGNILDTNWLSPSSILSLPQCTIIADLSAGTTVVKLNPLPFLSGDIRPFLGISTGFPAILPAGAQQITTADGKVSYYLDMDGHVIPGTVVGPPFFPLSTFTFNQLWSNNTLTSDVKFASIDGPVDLAQTFGTTTVNGDQVITSQTSTLTTPQQTVQFSDQNGHTTVTLGSTNITFSPGSFAGLTLATNAIQFGLSATSGGLTQYLTESLANGSLSWNIGGNTIVTVPSGSYSVNVATNSVDSRLDVTKIDISGNRTDNIFDAVNGAVQDTLVGYDPSGTIKYAVDVNASGTLDSFRYGAAQINPGDISSFVGSQMGQILGVALSKDSVVGRVAISTLIESIGKEIGKTLQFGSPFALTALGSGGGGQTLLDQDVNLGIRDMRPDFAKDLPGVGQISALLMAELADSLHLTGMGSGLFQTLGTTITAKLITNAFNVAVLQTDANGAAYGLFDGLDPLAFDNVFQNAIGGFLGNYLAGQTIIAHDQNVTKIGEIGGAVGAFLGTFLIPIPGLGTGIGSFLGKVAGTALGNLGSSNPSDWGSVYLDLPTDKLVVGFFTDNNNGSSAPMKIIAQHQVATVNSLVALTGGYITPPTSDSDPNQPGLTYGMSGPTFQILGNNGNAHWSVTNVTRAEQLLPMDDIGMMSLIHNIHIAGGDILMRTAWGNSQATNTSAFSVDLQIAHDYRVYLTNAPYINGLIAAEPTSAFATGWELTLLRAEQLGLNTVSVTDINTGNHTLTWYPGEGPGNIIDFGANGIYLNKVDLSAFPAFGRIWDVLAHTTQVGPDTVLNLGGGDVLTFRNVPQANLAFENYFTFAAPNPIDAPRTAAKAIDLNGDGRNDVLTHQDGGLLGLWEMNGPQITGGSPGSVTTPWHLEATGDFDGDGKTDLIWRNDNGSYELWEMNGFQTKLDVGLPSANASWRIEATGDFNGDGKSDIIWRNYQGSLVLWEMNGATKTLDANLTALPVNWKVVGAGDFSARGMSDIVVQDANTGAVELWELNGAVKILDQTIATLSSNWHIQGIGDFNGDHHSDILFRDSVSGTVVLWEMNGNQKILDVNVATVSLDWHIQAIGDYNGDGKSDIIWRNDNGTVVLWEMNGNQRILDVNIEYIPPDWHMIANHHDIV